MITEERELIIEEELLIIRDSGEIPEIAFHSTLEYLTRDGEGPAMVLTEEELSALHEAVIKRYLEIIRRDLTADNRSLSLFRGVERARVNWARLQRFCKRVQVDVAIYREDVARALIAFMTLECNEKRPGQASQSFNCSSVHLCDFISALHIPLDQLPQDWQGLCVPAKRST
ncbi:hypothetical protein [Desulfogranum marinum]|uniref:hypothetical protein n=1 Tax=Desulfogranum marinum TaxID=453220 RepID=UPI0029C79073|nr:hypothetical protein [Desulfogranum marinum]